VGFGRRGAICFVAAPTRRANSSVRRGVVHLASRRSERSTSYFRDGTLAMHAASRRGRERLVGTAIAGVAFVALFFPALFLGETFGDRDLASFHRPLSALVARLTSASSSFPPPWNPYFESGQPYAASPAHAYFHPLTTLFLLLPFESAFRMQVLLPVLAAALSIGFLLVTLGRSFGAAVFGAISFAFGGYLLSTTSLFPTLRTAAVLPLAAAFAFRLARNGRPRDAAGLAVSLGLAALAPEPTLLLAAPLLLVVAAYCGRKRSTGARPYARVALGAVLGLAIGGAALIPGLRLARKTARASGLPAEEALSRSLSPFRALELALPHAFGHLGNADAHLFWGGRLYRGQAGEQPLVVSLYPGLLATALAAAVLLRPGRRLRPWLGLGAVGLLLALGSHAGVFALLRRALPFLAGVRFPEKLVFLPILALTIAAATGFDRLRSARTRTARRAAAFLVAVLVITIAAAIVSFFAPLFVVHLFTGGASTDLVAVIRRDLLLAAATAALFTAALSRLGGRLASRAAVLLLALSAAELVFHGRELVSTVPAAALARPPTYLASLAARPPDGPLFFDAGHAAPGAEPADRIAPPRPAEWGLKTTHEIDYDATELSGSVEATRRFWHAVDDSPALLGPLLARRGVVAFVRVEATTPAGPRMVALPLSKTWPFAFVAPNVVFTGGPDGWLTTVRSLNASAADTVCLDERDREALPLPSSPGTAVVVERRPDAIAVDVTVTGPSPALLAVNQTWDDGWRATIDGRPSRLLRADISLSALVVPAGRHRIALTYRDPSLGISLGITLLGLIATAALVVLGRPRG